MSALPSHDLPRRFILYLTPSLIISALATSCYAQPHRAPSAPLGDHSTPHERADPMTRDAPPPSVHPLRATLRARHTSDLPTLNELSEIKGYDRGLMWLTLFGSPLQIRSRASRLLGEVESDEALALLLDRAQHAQRASLRASALRGLKSALARLTPTDPRHAQIIEVGHVASRSGDRRLQEAGRALSEQVSQPTSSTSARPATPSIGAPRVDDD